MLLVPVLVALLVIRTRVASNFAAAVFLAGAMSDGLDGYLARRYGATTRTGKWLDPLADKVLVSAPLVVLTARHEMPVWFAATIIAREVGIALLRAIQGLRGHEMPATQLAKVKTFLQLGVITLFIVASPATSPFVVMVLIATAAITLYTGFDYLARALGWIGKPAPVAREG